MKICRFWAQSGRPASRKRLSLLWPALWRLAAVPASGDGHLLLCLWLSILVILPQTTMAAGRDSRARRGATQGLGENSIWWPARRLCSSSLAAQRMAGRPARLQVSAIVRRPVKRLEWAAHAARLGRPSLAASRKPTNSPAKARAGRLWLEASCELVLRADSARLGLAWLCSVFGV